MSKQWEPDNVFDVLGDEYARQIVALASLEPVSAQDLADYCETSLPTVYRRLDILDEYDMIEEQVQVDDEGHHYKTFATSLDRVCFEVEEGSFHIDIELEKDLADRFGEFWRDLEAGSRSREDDE